MSTPMPSILNRVDSPVVPRNDAVADSFCVVELKAHQRNVRPCNWLYSSCRSTFTPRYTYGELNNRICMYSEQFIDLWINGSYLPVYRFISCMYVEADSSWLLCLRTCFRSSGSLLSSSSSRPFSGWAVLLRRTLLRLLRLLPPLLLLLLLLSQSHYSDDEPY